ncbi:MULTISPECIES: glucokinase [Burkholderia]|uniref:glucokinase n=1 Tax=Burkholderia TaxID=32008 RepID=UPI00119C10C3|nr:MULTISPECIES: glucokinase [Burkholderia]MDN7735353.1 glucokinase [Burkholderia gladioli]TWC78178.1 RpiR family transcriptional regulator [Burkholderia sp. SJZ089]TWD09224.1 RpiR family transcriptional regulator [Burkholderia sp. SJZ115]TWD12359.1 RpiR family transcriptional regulator [Burkholderia sp. SJZ091]
MPTDAKSHAVQDPDVAPYADGPRLLADIDETEARFMLETGPGKMGRMQTYSRARYSGIVDVIGAYVNDMRPGRINYAAIAVTQSVDGDQVDMGWHFSIEATRRALGLDTLLVVNDATALAVALPGLTDSQRVQLGGGARRRNGVTGLLSVGTHLRVRGLIPVADRWIALDSEGGHSAFAPVDEREDRVLHHARRHWPHVSYERVCTAAGIEVIHRALASRDRKCADANAFELVERALAGESTAVESVDVFCGILGSFAANIAITLGTLGGIHINGDLITSLGRYFARSPFRERFELERHAGSPSRDMPTYVIVARHPAFLGVSAMLAQRLSKRAGGDATAVFERIRLMRDALPPAERRVADLALHHPRSIVNEPIADIARRADVGPSTVIRFCRSLGWPSMSDFKLKLAGGLTETIPTRQRRVLPSDTVTEFGVTVLDNTISAILPLREHLNVERIGRAIDLLNGARRIEFYGFGDSNVVAQDAHHKFFRFGMPTVAYGDPYLQASSAALLGSRDVIVAVSRSGDEPELLRVLASALQAGARVIAVTRRDTPLAECATVALEEDHVGIPGPPSAGISRILHLMMIDMLSVGVASRRVAPNGTNPAAITDAQASADATTQAVPQPPGRRAAASSTASGGRQARLYPGIGARR